MLALHELILSIGTPQPVYICPSPRKIRGKKGADVHRLGYQET